MKFILMIGLLLPLTLCAQADKAKPASDSILLQLSGNIKGADGKKIFLYRINSPEPVVTAEVKKGLFRMKKKLEGPELLLLQVEGAQQQVPVFAGREAVVVNADISKLDKAKVTGSKTHAEFQGFERSFNPLFTKMGEINTYAQTRGVTDSLRSAAVAVQDQYAKALEAFIKARPASPVSAYVLLFHASRVNKEDPNIETYYEGLKPGALKNIYGKYLGELIETKKIGSVGSMAIDFTQNDTTGKPVALSSFKGKYVLVDFWASWCGPCRAENPNVVAAYNRYKDKNFTILGVSLDKAKEPWVQAIQQDGLIWSHVSDLKFWQNEVAQLYRIGSIPQNFLIDPTGKIIARNLRGPELDIKLQELLK